MADKKNYYNLDDIGFLGTREKKTTTSHKADAKRTAAFIRSKKSAKVFSLSRSVKTKVAK